MTEPTIQQNGSSSADGKRIASKEALVGVGVHTIMLPSGNYARVRIPDLALLVGANAVPEKLRYAALERVMDELKGTDDAALTPELLETAEGKREATPEQMQEAEKKIVDTVNLHVFLVQQMLVEPKFTLEELAPDSAVRPSDEDMQFLIQIARRERVTDAAGVRLGVFPISRAAVFREEHGCGEDCEDCGRALFRLSTISPSLV